MKITVSRFVPNVDEDIHLEQTKDELVLRIPTRGNARTKIKVGKHVYFANNDLTYGMTASMEMSYAHAQAGPVIVATGRPCGGPPPTQGAST